MGFLGGRREPIGLQIGKASVVAAQLSGRPHEPVLRTFAERLLPPGIVFEGEVLDPESLAVELKALFKESSLKGKVVRVGVGNQKVVVRNIEVPDMDPEELRGAIEFQAQDYIPLPIENVTLDYQVVGRQVDEDGVVRQKVLLVAAQTDMIQQFLTACHKAGLVVEGIDLNAFAVLRALTPPIPFLEQGAAPEEATGFLNIESSVNTLVVAAAGIPMFTRISSFAYDNFQSVLVEHQGVPPEDARALTELIGVPGPLAAFEESYSAATVTDVRGTLERVADQFSADIRRSLDYYLSQEYAVPVAGLVLSGRGPLLRNLDSYLSESLGLPVEIGNSMVRIVANKTGYPDEYVAAMAPRLAVPIGLALDEVE
jgi:type IV pilus assembly protein PilM